MATSSHHSQSSQAASSEPASSASDTPFQYDQQPCLHDETMKRGLHWIRARLQASTPHEPLLYTQELPFRDPSHPDLPLTVAHVLTASPAGIQDLTEHVGYYNRSK